MKKMFSKAMSFLLCSVMVLVFLPAPSVKAATVTKENPVIFDVRGSVDASGNVTYTIFVEDIYSQDYQSFNITYPAEMSITVPPTIGVIWTQTDRTDANGITTTSSFIIRTGTRNVTQLKADLNSIGFTLTSYSESPPREIFPPENSKVAIIASASKLTMYVDPNQYVHYYEFVPFLLGPSGDPLIGNNTSVGAANYKSWLQAYNIAHSRSMQDPRFPDDPSKVLHGYLATITSEEEQIQLYSQIADWSGWLGGTRMRYGTAVSGKSGQKIQDEGTKYLPASADIHEISMSSIWSATPSATQFTTGNWYHADAADSKWYWADGPEAWTVYNATAEKYTYYPVGMITVPTDAWVIRDSSNNDTYIGSMSELISSGQLSHEPEIGEPVQGGTLQWDRNRGAVVGSLEFFTGPQYVSTGSAKIAGVYSNFNNPRDGIVHFFDENKNLVGQVASGTGVSAPGEPNGAANVEYCLQFAYPSATYTYGAYTNPKPDTWNDYSFGTSANLYGYFIEYGGYWGDPKIGDLAGVETESESDVQIPMPIRIQYRSMVEDSTSTPSDPVYRQISSIGTTKDRLITYKDHTSFTAVRDNDQDLIDLAAGAGDYPGYIPYGYKFIGATEDFDAITTNSAGDVSGFHSTHFQRIIFLYQPKSLTVTFNANFDGWSSADVSPGSKTVLFDSPYGVLATATRPGYTNIGWFMDTAGSIPAGPEGVLDSDLASDINGDPNDHTLYAQWKVNSDYIIKYDLNGGTTLGDPSAFDDVVGVRWTDPVTIPTEKPTRDGYIFTGWNMSYNGTKQGVTTTDTYGEIAGNDAEPYITLEAQWLEDSLIKVYYHPNGADTPLQSEVPLGELALLSDLVQIPNAVRKGYTFMGWKVVDNDAGDSSDNRYFEDDNNIYQFHEIIASAEHYIVLEAQWEEITYVVYYNANKPSAAVGTPTPDSWPEKEDVRWNQNGLVPPKDASDNSANPTLTRYVFKGWNTEPDGAGITVYVGTSFSQLVSDDSVMSTILYAQWEAEKQYEVRYDLNGGQVSTLGDDTPIIVYADVCPIIPANDPTRIGYEFGGWKVSVNGTKLGVTDTDTYGDLAANTVAGHITLQAQWSPKSGYHVIYDANSGTLPGGSTTSTKPAVVPPVTPTDEPYVVWSQPNLLPLADPTMTGSTFIGWNTQSDGNGINVTSAHTFGELALVQNGNDTVVSITLYAKYAVDTVYTVRYDLNGGTGTHSDVTLYSGDISTAYKFNLLPPTPPMGYDFVGWYYNNGHGQIIPTLIMPDSDVTYNDLVYPGAKVITLIAQYAEKDDFTILYDWNWSSGSAPNLPENTAVNVKWTDSGFVPFEWNDSGSMRGPYQPYHNFLGWTTDENGLSPYVLNTDQYRKLASNDDTVEEITLYAKWEDAYFEVRYDLNGATYLGDDPSKYNTKTQVGADDIGLVPAKPWAEKLGYALVGWDVSEGGSSKNVQSTDSYRSLANPGAQYITLIAVWEAKSYTVYYDYAGGSSTKPGGLPSTDPGDVKWTSMIPFPGYTSGYFDIERPGYTHEGWVLTKVGDTILSPAVPLNVSNARYSDYAFDPGTNNDVSNITVQAVWETKGGYTVNYGLDGGYYDGASSVTARTGITWTTNNLLPGGALYDAGMVSKAGYSFTGWNVTFGGSGTGITSANTYGDLATNDGTSSIAFTAQWTEKTNITITYQTITQYPNGSTRTENDGGTISILAESVAPATGAASGSAVDTPMNTGYTFLGWYASPYTASSTPIETGTAFVPAKTHYADGDAYEAATYVAVFREDAAITITFGTKSFSSDWSEQTDSFGGNVSPSGAQSYAPVTGTPSSTAYTNPGYSFVGWFGMGDDYENDTPTAATLALNPAKSGGLNVAGSYVAVFQEDTNVTINYSQLTFDTDGTTPQDPLNGGTIERTTQSVAPVTGTPSSLVSVNAGYIFIGWYDDTDTSFTTRLDTGVTPMEPFVPAKESGVFVAHDYVAVFKELSGVPINYAAITENGESGGALSLYFEDLAPATDIALGSTATANAGYEFVGWFAADDTSYEYMLSGSPTFIPDTVDGLNVAGDYVAYFRIIYYSIDVAVYKDDVAWSDGGAPEITLKETPGSAPAEMDRLRYGATYGLYANGVYTGIDVDYNSVSATLDFYTVRYSVVDLGDASGSTIGATYDGLVITGGGATLNFAGGASIASGDVVLRGGDLVITAAGAGAVTRGSYTYRWSGAGTSGETTDSIAISHVNGAVDALCKVTGTNHYAVTIYVVDENVNPIENVEVGIWQKGKKINNSTDRTDADGLFNIDDPLPAGIYNIVLTYTDADGNETTITEFLLVDSEGIYKTVTMPLEYLGRLNSKFTQDANPAVPVVAVDNLHEVYNAPPADSPENGVTADDIGIFNDGGSITIRLVASEVDALDPYQGPQKTAIEVMIDEDGKVFGFDLDLSAYKDVLDKEGAPIVYDMRLNELNGLVTVYVYIPDAHQGEKGYAVYRYHGDKAERIPQYPVKNGYGEYFDVDADGTLITLTVRKFSVYTVAYNDPNPAVPDVAVTVTLDDSFGGGESKTVTMGESMVLPEPDPRAGYTFDGWVDDDGNVYPTGVSITINFGVTLTARWKSDQAAYIVAPAPAVPEAAPDPLMLNAEDHPAYIVGYPDGTVRPAGMITREEVATIFFRLLEDDVRDSNLSSGNAFKDVNGSRWSNKAISTMAQMNIVQGYPDSSFSPGGYITRAEFVTIVARFFDAADAEGVMPYSDVAANHWAAGYILSAYNAGVVIGYPDGTFRPDAQISRAEAVTIINRLLNRYVESENDMSPNMARWSDNADTNAWYYYDIQEATNSHDYSRKDDGNYEVWGEILPNRDWTMFEK